MAINTFLTCPTDCDDALLLPAIPVVQDCTSYSQRYAQVCGIVLQPDAASVPLDWTAAPTVTEVTDEIDNTDAVGLKSKYVVGEGEIPEPTKVEDEYPKRKKKTSFRTYRLNLTVKNMEDEMYEFLRALQCGNTAFRLWYETVGGWIFGGEDGIDITFVDVVFNRPGGKDDKESATIQIEWEADGDPARGLTPF